MPSFKSGNTGKEIYRYGNVGKYMYRYGTLVFQAVPEWRHSVLTSLSVARCRLMSAPLGSGAIVAGGQVSSIGYSNVVDYYDESKVRSTLTALYNQVGYGAAAKVSTGAFVVSGSYSSYARHNHYDLSRVRSVVTSANGQRLATAGASHGNGALFAGGLNSGTPTNLCYYLSEAKVLTTKTNLGTARGYLSAAPLAGGVAFFGGSTSNSGTDAVSVVDYYNASFTRSTISALAGTSWRNCAAQLGTGAIVAGGSDPYIQHYDNSLARTTIGNLAASGDYSMLTASECAQGVIISGGYQSKSAVFLIDLNNVITTLDALSVGRHDLTSCRHGDGVLVAGGRTNSGTTISNLQSTVDFYEFK
jgi:hypothetical protein